jgi:hypothetical protein
MWRTKLWFVKAEINLLEYIGIDGRKNVKIDFKKIRCVNVD